MEIRRRALKGTEFHAEFTPDGRRLLVFARYFYALDVPSLRIIYRVRPLPGLERFVMQMNGEHVLAPYRGGRFALLSVENGEVVATCGDGSYVELRQYALSTCGDYMIQIRTEKDIRVREIRSDRVVWERGGAYESAAPIGNGNEWALFSRNGVEVWRWPFGDEPDRVFDLGCRSFWPRVRGTLAALDTYREMPIIDLRDGSVVFTAKGGSHARPHLREDGSVVVTQEDELLLYSSTGQLLRTVRAPRIGTYGHAFSPVHDNAALSFEGGIVLVRDLSKYFDSHDEVESGLTVLEQDVSHTSEDWRYRPQVVQKSASIEASSAPELKRALIAFRRTAWKPVLKAEASPPDGSKFGGVPWLATGEAWPRCGQCGAHLDLFLQLNSADLPRESPRFFEGLLQVFACSTETYSGGLCDSSDPYSNAAFVRVVQPEGASSVAALPEQDLFQEMHIVDWLAEEDYPGENELSLLGSKLNKEQWRHLHDTLRFPLSGDKLFGWAAWQQGVERVACKECRGPMREIFQIDSLEAVPLMFGDGGRGWVSQCPDHPHVVSFSWTCG